MADAARDLLASNEPADLGPGPRASAWPRDRVKSAVDAFLEGRSLPAARGPLIRALVLLWHDHPDPAHTLVQEGEDLDSACIHAILHRREPDFSNAKYWFRRVRGHPSHDKLAAQVSALLDGHGEKALAAHLVPQGRWDPFAFVDACQAAGNRQGGNKNALLLREIQQREFEALLDHLCSTK